VALWWGKRDGGRDDKSVFSGGFSGSGCVGGGGGASVPFPEETTVPSSRLSVCSIMILPSPLVLSDGEATIVGLVRRGKACSGQWIEPLLPLHPKIKVVVYPIMLLPHHEEKNEA